VALRHTDELAARQDRRYPDPESLKSCEDLPVGQRSVMRTITSCLSIVVLVLIASSYGSGTKADAARAAQTTFKVAYYNIQSGMGMTQLSGTCSFERNSNCTDASQPLNAWGRGVVQAELDRAVNSDSSIIALGLSEAWSCANPAAVLAALGWAAHAGERNGISLLARYGFAGSPEWVQLDTSLNTNPADTMWVVRAPVCADASCTRSIEVFSSHWYASGATRTESFERQAHGTVAFLERLPASEPRVLIGDLNVWEEPGTVCNQTPVPTAVQILKDAGYLDGWPAVHGTAEGYTGMWNRNGCGDPNGNLWKRIDHAWSKSLAAPISMSRFGMVTPGACAPSDHAGITTEYAWPGAEPIPSFDFSISANPSSRTVNAGATTTYDVTIVLIGGQAQPISLAVTGLPAGAAASFTPSSLPGSGTSTLKITTRPTTPGGTYSLTIAGTGGGATRTTTVALQIVRRR
jgi:hypothetical protein